MIFCCFRCVTHRMSPLTSVYTDVLYIYICCFITITKFLCWWSIINHLLSKAMKTLNLKYFGITILIFRGHVTPSITWPLDSAYVVSYWWSIVTMHLSCTVTEIWAPNLLGSRPWPLGVTWRHRSRDHRTRRGHFSIGSQWVLSTKSRNPKIVCIGQWRHVITDTRK